MKVFAFLLCALRASVVIKHFAFAQQKTPVKGFPFTGVIVFGSDHPCDPTGLLIGFSDFGSSTTSQPKCDSKSSAFILRFKLVRTSVRNCSN
jgi:hypothetical protein